MKKTIIRRLMITMMLLMIALPFVNVKASAKSIYTGNPRVDAAAEAIISRCTTPNMNSNQKLYCCYSFLVKNMKYSHRSGKVRVKPTSAEYQTYFKNLNLLASTGNLAFSKKFKGDWRNLLTLQGTCKDMSGVMCILANHLGFAAGYCTGRYVRGNGSSVEHWWNWVNVGGKILYCDVQASNASWKKHHKKSSIDKFFCKTKRDKTWRKHHRG